MSHIVDTGSQPRQYPDVLLIDISPPALTATRWRAACDRITLRAGASRGLVAVTSFAQKKDQPRPLEAGFDAHLVKAVTKETARAGHSGAAMIILVEDDPDQRLTIRQALELERYTVRVAPNGHDALALQRERASRFLITDIFMPDMDGFELIDAFRLEFPQTKIIVVSGGGARTRGDYLESARLLGVDATLHKPFEIETLLDTLRALEH